LKIAAPALSDQAFNPTSPEVDENAFPEKSLAVFSGQSSASSRLSMRSGWNQKDDHVLAHISG
jgi:hypothetical protein